MVATFGGNFTINISYNNLFMISEQNQKFKHLQQNYLLEVTQVDEGGLITVIDYRNQQNVKKYVKWVKFSSQQNQGHQEHQQHQQDQYLLDFFDSYNQFMFFLQERENFNVELQQISTFFCIKWVFSGKSFQKSKSTKIQMEQVDISQNQGLRMMNKILKMKLTSQNPATNLIKEKNIEKQKQKQKFINREENQKKIITKDKSIFQDFISSQNQAQSLDQLSSSLDNDYDYDSDFSSQSLQKEESQFNDKNHKPSLKYKQINRKSDNKNKQLKSNYRLNKTKKIIKGIQKKTKPKKIPKKSTQNRNKDKDKDKQKQKQKQTKKTKQPEGYTITKVDKNTFRVDFEDGDYYTGEMKNKLYDGKGFYFSKRNGTYDGYWKNGKADGYGVCIDQLGNKLSGFFKNDKRYGQGADQYSNGQRYQGNFQDQNKSGWGTYYFKDGSKFSGYFKQSCMHGKGKKTYPDGGYFVGQWNNDVEEGQGVLCKDGKILLQEFKKGTLVKQKQITQEEREQFQQKFDLKKPQ